MEHPFGSPKCWPYRYVCGPAIESENERAEPLHCAQVDGVTIRWENMTDYTRDSLGRKEAGLRLGPEGAVSHLTYQSLAFL